MKECSLLIEDIIDSTAITLRNQLAMAIAVEPDTAQSAVRSEQHLYCTYVGTVLRQFSLAKIACGGAIRQAAVGSHRRMTNNIEYLCHAWRCGDNKQPAIGLSHEYDEGHMDINEQYSVQDGVCKRGPILIER